MCLDGTWKYIIVSTFLITRYILNKYRVLTIRDKGAYGQKDHRCQVEPLWPIALTECCIKQRCILGTEMLAMLLVSFGSWISALDVAVDSQH